MTQTQHILLHSSMGEVHSCTQKYKFFLIHFTIELIISPHMDVSTQEKDIYILIQIKGEK